MSKYNLTDLYEGMGRGGTVNDSFYSIANLADDIDGQNIGIDTYPIQVQRLGPSEDGKTNEEIVVRYGPGHYDYFSIYDYKFGEDPTDEDNYDNDYPFSLGIPTKNTDGKQWAAKLGFNVEGMNEATKENIKEEEGFDEVNIEDLYDTIEFNLNQLLGGHIEKDDFWQAIKASVEGEPRPPLEESEPLDEEMGPTGIGISKSQIDQLLDKGSIMGLEVVVTDKDGSNARKVDYILSNTDHEKDPDDYDDVREHFDRFM